MQFAGLGLLVALGPADHRSVLEVDHLSLLKTLQGDENPVCPVRVVELQYRWCGQLISPPVACALRCSPSLRQRRVADLSPGCSWVLDRSYANFVELRQCELRRILLPRTRVNSGKL